MDQNSLSKRLMTYKWPLVIAVTVTTVSVIVSAIVVKSPPVASLVTPVPHVLGQLIEPPKSSEEAFDTPFFNAKEEALTLRAFNGRGVVLNFWATWCAPCVREMPALDRMAAKLKPHGIHVIALSEDRKALDLVPPFYANKGIENLDIYFDVKSQLSRRFAVAGLPTTVLINADGQEVGRITGALEWDEDAIVDAITLALAPKTKKTPKPVSQ